MQETAQYQFFFVSSVSFPVKRPYVVYGLSTSLSPAMLHFKILMFWGL